MGLVIGLLGGVACGKSTVASLLAKRGLVVLDADAEARAAVEDPEVLGRLVERFGASIRAPDGSLDRSALAAVAFADAAATADLNALVHPAVRAALLSRLKQAGDGHVVLDVPLLLESPLADMVDVWVYVAAEPAARDARAAQRGWKPDERERREARQASLQSKRAHADHVLENNGTIDDLEAQVDGLLTRLGVSPSS